MIFSIFDPPDGKRTWPERCVGAIVDALDWDYEKLFCGVGTFELLVSVKSADASKLKLNRFLLSSDGDFVIKQLQYGADSIKVSGYDLNGLLLDRLTVAKTDDGKDKVQGSTESIVKHFVDVNCVSSDDAGRNFPGLWIEGNQNRGIANDAASPRLECLADVISDILSAQQMGWRISAINVRGGGASVALGFYVYEAVNRTMKQTQRNPMTFSYGQGSANSIKSENSIAGAKNTLYCELADGTVQTYSPISGNVGFERTEEYADLGCELSELSVYAEHEIADRFGAVQNVTLEHVDPSGYGSRFFLGDIVTVVDDHANTQLEALITAVKIKRAGNDLDVTVTIGEARTKLIDRVSKKVGAIASSVKGGSGGNQQSDRLVCSDGSEIIIVPDANYPVEGLTADCAAASINDGNLDVRTISSHLHFGDDSIFLERSYRDGVKVTTKIDNFGISFARCGDGENMGDADFALSIIEIPGGGQIGLGISYGNQRSEFVNGHWYINGEEKL